MTKSYWNYRLINHGTHIALHEVYYTNDKPHTYTTEPATLVYDTDEPIDGEWIAKGIKEAFDKPVLNASDFAKAD